MKTIKPNREEQLAAFGRLLDIMDELREQCPWDRKQTLSSLTKLTIEEVYEAVEAIQNNDLDELEGELGDLFLHLVFYAKIGSEKGIFDAASILHRVCEKLIQRHPHIYGNIKVEDEEEVKRNWEQIKLKEGRKSVLGGVPNSMPALIRAYRIQEKAAGVGFDFERTEEVTEKIKEELNEFLEADSEEERKDEFGDLLFSLVNLARFLKIDCEESLQQANRKFINRFEQVEKQVREEFGSFDKIHDKNRLAYFWDNAKKNS